MCDENETRVMLVEDHDELKSKLGTVGVVLNE